MTDFEDFEKAKARATEAARLAREQELQDLREVLQLPAGRRFVGRLVGSAGPFRVRFDPDPCTNAYQLGRREAVYGIVGDILEHMPEQWPALWQRERNQ